MSHLMLRNQNISHRSEKIQRNAVWLDFSFAFYWTKQVKLLYDCFIGFLKLPHCFIEKAFDYLYAPEQNSSLETLLSWWLVYSEGKKPKRYQILQKHVPTLDQSKWD